MGEPAVFIGVSSNEDAEVAQLVSPAHTRPVAGGRPANITADTVLRFIASFGG